MIVVTLSAVRQRTIVVLAVSLATVLAAVVLAGTSWVTQQAKDVGNPTLGTDASLAGSLAVEPTAFYEPPPTLPDVAPGALLRTEQIDDAPDGVAAWRILYLSTDNAGEPIAISGVYYEPTRVPDEGARFPLVALAHGTTGVSRSCGVSQAPFTPQTPGFEYWTTIAQPLVDAGYAVVATDYEGMGAPGKTPYLLRKQAYDVLDSMRAALAFRPGYIDSTNLAIIGHSEGGYVALTTADQAGQYAPELSIRGSVVLAPGVIPPLPFGVRALTSQTRDEAASPRSGYITTLSQSWLANYPDLMTPEEWYTPEGRATVEEAAKACQGEMVQILSGTFGEYFQATLPPSVVEVAGLNPPLLNGTAIPLLIQQGLADTSVVPQLSRALAIEACDLGGTVEYQEYPLDSHRSVQYTGRPAYLDWLADRFAGEPAPSQCRRLA